MKNKTGLSWCCLVCLSLAGCERAPRDRADIAMLVDVSGSQARNCACLSATARAALAWPNVRRQSRVWLAHTGDAATAFEPRIVAQFELPRVNVLEGRDTSAEQHAELLGRLTAQCGQLAPARVSPIFAGLKRLVEKLQTAPLGPSGWHYLIVKTDGAETAEPALHAALADAAAPLDALPKIDNRQVKILFRGLAETVRPNDSRLRPSADRARAVWQAVFTEPDLVGFDPLCETPAEGRLASR